MLLGKERDKELAGPETELATACTEEIERVVPTASVTVVECTKLPLVPVIVSVGLPVGVLAVVVMVSVELPDVVIDVGTKEDDAPAGNPVAAKLTVPVNPPSAPTFTV